jgi:hypothetical protein
LLAFNRKRFGLDAPPHSLKAGLNLIVTQTLIDQCVDAGHELFNRWMHVTGILVPARASVDVPIVFASDSNLL